MANNPEDAPILTGPAAQIIGRQGGRTLTMLQPAVVGAVIYVPLLLHLAEGDLPVPHQDPRSLSITPELFAGDDAESALTPQAYASSGALMSLACLGIFEIGEWSLDALRLTVSSPLLDDVITHRFAIG